MSMSTKNLLITHTRKMSQSEYS